MKTSTRLRGGAAAGAVALLAGLAFPTQAFAAEAPVVLDDPITFDTGHIDAFNLALNEDDSVQLNLKEDVTGSHVMRTPESVTLQVKGQAYADDLPAHIAPEDTTGPFYYLPMTQDYNLIWPGWDTGGVASVYGTGAATDISVTDVEGPGEVYLWIMRDYAEPVDTGGSWTLPGTISVPQTAHVHANWGFTEPGTYTLKAQATVEGNGLSSTSNEATYTFNVAPAPTGLNVTGAEEQVEEGSEVTLSAVQTPEGADWADYAWYTRDSESAEWEQIDGETGGALTVEAVDGAQYYAAVSGGKDYSGGARPTPFVIDSAPVTIQAAEAETPEQSLTIEGLSHHYHQNTPIVLNAVADPAVEGGSYEWFLQRKDQPEPVRVDGQNEAEFRITAEQALDGAQVTANVLDADGEALASADAVMIDVDDHGADPLQQITIDGLSHHYHTGDTATLTANVEPSSVLDRFEWLVQREGETEWELIAGENGSTYAFEVTEELDGAQVMAKLTYNDGEEYVASEPVTIEIDDHGEHPEPVTALSIEGLADEYNVGDVATLTAVQDPDTGEDHYHWFIQRAGEDDFSVISGALTDVLEYEVAEGDDGAQIKAVLYNHDHEIITESDPVSLNVAESDVPAPATELTIEGLLEEYEVGDVAELTAVQDPDTGEDHYHWFIQRAGDEGYTVIDGALSSTLQYTVTEEDEGAQIIARLYDHDHAQLAESEPVALSLAGDDAPGDEEPGDDTPGDEQPGGGSDEPGAKGPGGLATTGGDLTAMVTAAGVLLALGAATILLARRRVTEAGE